MSDSTNQPQQQDYNTTVAPWPSISVGRLLLPDGRLPWLHEHTIEGLFKEVSNNKAKLLEDGIHELVDSQVE